MGKLLKKYGFPDQFIADDLRSYGAAGHDFGIERRHEPLLDSSNGTLDLHCRAGKHRLARNGMRPWM
jgi:hypothetical protein